MKALEILCREYVARFKRERKNHSQPYRPRFRLFVIARSHRQAEDWARSSGVSRGDMVYVYSPEVLRGQILQPAQIIKLEGWGAHPHAARIADAARYCVLTNV